MRAEDALTHMALMEASISPDDSLGDVMLREGIAYDELARFLLLGAFRAAQARDDAPPAGFEDDAEMEKFSQGRLWLDGFLVGRRMAVAECTRDVDKLIDKRLAEALAAALLRFGLPPDTLE